MRVRKGVKWVNPLSSLNLNLVFDSTFSLRVNGRRKKEKGGKVLPPFFTRILAPNLLVSVQCSDREGIETISILRISRLRSNLPVNFILGKVAFHFPLLLYQSAVPVAKVPSGDNCPL